MTRDARSYFRSRLHVRWRTRVRLRARCGTKTGIVRPGVATRLLSTSTAPGFRDNAPLLCAKTSLCWRHGSRHSTGGACRSIFSEQGSVGTPCAHLSISENSRTHVLWGIAFRPGDAAQEQRANLDTPLRVRLPSDSPARGGRSSAEGD